VKADAETRQEVLAVVERLANGYAQRDLAAVLRCFAPDEDVFLFGTGADERRVGPAEVQAQVERDWAQSDYSAFVLTGPSVSAAGSVAWLASEGRFELRVENQEMSFPARATFVLEQRGDRWLIVQAHFSLPAESQEEGSSF
jgi:ketosteroid isomerase-like protein